MQVILTWIAIVVVGGLVVAAVVAYERRRNRIRAESLSTMAAQHGWTLQPSPGGNLEFALAGRDDDVMWEVTGGKMRGTGARGSDRSETVWRTNDVKLGEDGFAAVGPRLGEVPPNFNLDSGLMAQMVRFGLEQLFQIDLTGLTLHEVGSTLFQRNFMALARTSAIAQRLVSSGVESQMLDWPKGSSVPLPPVVIADANGVIVRVSSHGLLSDEPERLERMIALGIAASDAIKRD